jgi:tetratricopeptide (TPR) repeat protein
MKSKFLLCLALVLTGVFIVWLLEHANLKISIARQPEKLNSTNAEFYDNRAVVEGKKGEVEKTIGDLTEAIKLDPKDAYAYAHRALALALKGKYDQALTDINTAIELKPNEAEYYFQRAGIDVFKGDLRGEINDCNQAIKLNPNTADYYARRAAGYAQLGKYDQAMSDCNKAIQLNPDLAGAYATRAIVYGQTGDMDKAMDDLNEAIRLDPKDEQAHRNRAVLFLKKGDADAAIADFGKVIQLNPRAVESYRMRGMLYLSKHDFDPAISDFTALLKLDSTNSEAYANRMGAYWLKGDYQNGVADCKMLVQLNPGKSHDWNELALMLATCPEASARDGKEAVVAAKKACELSEWQMPPYIASLAAAYAEAGDFKQAVKYQQQALAMPGWPETSRDDMQKRLQLYQQGKPFHEPPFSDNQAGQDSRQQPTPAATSGTDEPASTATTNAASALTNSVLLEIDGAATYLKELKKQGYLPGVPKSSHSTITTGNQSASKLKRLRYPFTMTFLATLAEDSSTNHYTVMQTTKAAAWQLNRAWQTDPQGRIIKEWPVTSVPRLQATAPSQDLTNLAAMQNELSSHQAMRGPLMRELRAAAKLLTELGRSGRLPGMFAHHGHEQVTIDASPFKEVNYPFVVTFRVNEAGESLTNHYMLVQSAEDAPWQLQKAWRTDAEGHTIKEWQVK